MNLPSILYAVRWLVSDTFRQAFAGRIFWFMIGASAACILFCLGVSIEGGTVRDEGELWTKEGRVLSGQNPSPGTLNLFFGAWGVDIGRGREDAVQLLEVVLGSWVAGTVGLLLTLVWTASFIPDFLQPNSAIVLLAKPVPRGIFLLGKFLGVVAFVAFQAFIFFFGTWLALGLKTQVWTANYLGGWPLLVFQFAVFYSFSVLIAVTWRSTVACVLAVLLFWVICMGVNYGRYSVHSLPKIAPEAKPLGPATRVMIEASYWILPKPADSIMMLEDILDAGKVMTPFGSLPEFRHSASEFNQVLSLVTSLAFGAVMLTLAGFQLAKNEY